MHFELLVLAAGEGQGRISAWQKTPATWGRKEGPPRFNIIDVLLDYPPQPGDIWSYETGELIRANVSPEGIWYDTLPAFDFVLKGEAIKPSEQKRFAPIVPGKRRAVTCDVVIPYYKQNLEWIIDSVESIINQVHAKPIIHLVKDGYREFSDNTLFDALKDEENIRWYGTATKQGPYRLINSLLDYLETDFIVIQDADDLAAPNRLWRSVRILSDYGYDLFSGSMEQFVDYKHKHDKQAALMLSQVPMLMSGVFWGNCPQGALINGATTIRKSCFEAINGFADYDSGSDRELMYRIWRMGMRVFLSHQITGWRRLHDDSLSTSQHKLRPERVFNPVGSNYFDRIEDPDTDLKTFGSLDSFRAGDLLEIR